MHDSEVNGLAILTQQPDLADNYGHNVVAWPAAFVIAIAIDGFNDFARAMRLKLSRQTGRGQVSKAAHHAGTRASITGARIPRLRARREAYLVEGA